MQSYAIVLVLVSAFLHSIWNFLLKGSGNKTAFVYILNILISIIFLPVVLFSLGSTPVSEIGILFAILSGLIHAVYFILLSKAYSHGHLSIVYPLARSSLLFVPIWAFLLLGEKLSLEGILGILLIILGIYILHLRKISLNSLLEPFQYIREKGSVFAILTALTISFYSIVDKVGVSFLNPVPYIYIMFLFIVVFLTPYVLLNLGNSLRPEWNKNRKNIVASSVLCVSSYLLILFAFQLSKVSYIISLRQISVIIGVLLGIMLLKEKYGRIRLIASVVMFAGFFLVSIAN